MLRRWLQRRKQKRCVHWFLDVVQYNHLESRGAIVCCEQKTWDVTVETRRCFKCDYSETREVTRTYEGWT